MTGSVLTGESIGVRRSSRQIQVLIHNHDNEPRTAIGDTQLQGNPVPADGELAEIMKELEYMIGLDHVKRLVYEIYALLQVNQYRSQAGLQPGSQVYHMVFKGNPGTGKTTVARILARMFKAMGVLKKGHLVEVERADLVGEYIGHTAIKTRDLIKKAMGGILFVDEAYSLARGGEKDFGKESIDCMVKSMEDHKEDFVLILAGYPEEMDAFLATNPGLPSRFPIQVDFPDYSVEELLQIAEQMVKERDYLFSPLSLEKLRQHLNQAKEQLYESFSNARYVRNMIEKSVRHQAVRLIRSIKQPSRQDLMAIRPEDLKFDKMIYR